MTAFYYFCGHEQWQPETLVDHAVAAEAAGFDGLLVSEHFHPWVDDAGASGYAFATIGAIARATRRVRLATGVTTPLFRHHPAVVAQAAATLDRLSGGRFDLGVGTGENINEAPLGLPFPRYGERARRLGEALEIMRRLLDGEKLTFDGRYYRTDRARLYSPPLARVPIWMAAGGPQSAALAAEHGRRGRHQRQGPGRGPGEGRAAGPAGRGRGRAPRPAPWWPPGGSIAAVDEEEAWQALLPWRGLRAPGAWRRWTPRTCAAAPTICPAPRCWAATPSPPTPMPWSPPTGPWSSRSAPTS